MKKSNAFVHVASSAALAAAAYCCAAYAFIQSALTPEAGAIPPWTDVLGGITVPALLIAGLYHILLLARALRGLAQSRRPFVHSCFLVGIVLSGITLLSDVTLLSDIGKEYRTFDVSDQWWLLYAFTAFHIAVIVYGWQYLARTPVPEGKTPGERGWDAMFFAIHRIGLICGVLGAAGLLFTLTGLFVSERFIPLWTALVAALAIVPTAAMGGYWLLRSRRRTLPGRLDEKQAADASAGAVVSLLSVAVFIGAACVAVLAGLAGLSPVFWLCAVFFVGLIGYTAAVIARNRVERE